MCQVSVGGRAAVSSGEPLSVSHRLEYAVQALMSLARAEGPLTAEQMANEDGLPRLYLLVILRDLTAAGLLASRRGRRGGFSLLVGPAALTVADVHAALGGQAEATPGQPGPDG